MAAFEAGPKLAEHMRTATTFNEHNENQSAKDAQAWAKKHPHAGHWYWKDWAHWGYDTGYEDPRAKQQEREAEHSGSHIEIHNHITINGATDPKAVGHAIVHAVNTQIRSGGARSGTPSQPAAQMGMSMGSW